MTDVPRHFDSAEVTRADVYKWSGDLVVTARCISPPLTVAC